MFSSVAQQYTVFVIVWACAVCYCGDTGPVQIRPLSLGGLMDLCVSLCVLGGK